MLISYVFACKIIAIVKIARETYGPEKAICPVKIHAYIMG